VVYNWQTTKILTLFIGSGGDVDSLELTPLLSSFNEEPFLGSFYGTTQEWNDSSCVNNVLFTREYSTPLPVQRTMQRRYFSYPIRFYGPSKNELFRIPQTASRSFGYHVFHPLLPFVICRFISYRTVKTCFQYFNPTVSSVGL
jgi:hypothetical protein